MKIIKTIKNAAQKITLTALIAAASLAPGCKGNDYDDFEQPPVNSSTILEIQEPLADHFGTLNRTNTAFLNDGITQTPLGGALYTQQINVGNLAVVFGEDERDRVGHYLYCNDGDRLFTYQMTFPTGLHANQASDFVGAPLNIMGKDYRITNATLDVNNVLDLELTSLDNLHVVRLSNYLNDMATPGTVEVDGERIEDANIMFNARTAGMMVTLDSLVYTLDCDATLGDLFVPPGSSVAPYLDEPQGMLGFDIAYDGFNPFNSITLASIRFAGDDEADIEFTNKENIFYSLPIVSNEAGNEAGGVLKWGDDDDNLHFREGVDIQDDDFFILNKPGTDFTHVLRYDSVDTTQRQLTFTDLGTGTREIAYDAQTNEGDLVVAGELYKVKFNPLDKTIRVDLNGDGSYVSPASVYLMTKSGTKIEFADDPMDPLAGKLVYFTVAGEKFDGKPPQGETVAFALRPKPGNTLESELVSGSDLVLFQVEQNPSLSQGLTRYGNFFEQYLKEDVWVEIPETQREALVRFSGGN